MLKSTAPGGSRCRAMAYNLTTLDVLYLRRQVSARACNMMSLSARRFLDIFHTDRNFLGSTTATTYREQIHTHL